MKEFVLPEKWCLKGSKEFEEWMPDNSDCLGDDEDAFYYPSNSEFTSWSYRFSKNGRTEITFEQFKEHVLKIKTETKMKKTRFHN